jgi:cbb3-type cytochrome oxidase subunit 3
MQINPNAIPDKPVQSNAFSFSYMSFHKDRSIPFTTFLFFSVKRKEQPHINQQTQIEMTICHFCKMYYAKSHRKKEAASIDRKYLEENQQIVTTLLEKKERKNILLEGNYIWKNGSLALGKILLLVLLWY